MAAAAENFSLSRIAAAHRLFLVVLPSDFSEDLTGVKLQEDRSRRFSYAADPADVAHEDQKQQLVKDYVITPQGAEYGGLSAMVPVFPDNGSLYAARYSLFLSLSHLCFQ